jgi:hypothetical protein
MPTDYSRFDAYDDVAREVVWVVVRGDDSHDARHLG